MVKSQLLTAKKLLEKQLGLVYLGWYIIYIY